MSESDFIEPSHELEENEEEQQHHLEEIEIQLLLEGIYLAYGYDFRHYLRSSIHRRVRSRVNLDNLPSITALLDKVLHEPEYFHLLANDFSIKVTEMYRDPHFFRLFRDQVVPLLRNKSEIRIWHAGCSTGEEVYSMAILLLEEGLLHRTKLYATDMNEQAIQKAKLGKFPLKRMQSFTKNYLQAGGVKEFSSYYTTDREYAIFHPELADHIVFAQHNLATDSTFNEFHVILCRNVLIYFDATLQQRVHQLFYESLGEGGILGLGSMESLLAAYKPSYEELAPAERIFRKR
ncbi:CheR family methyltransferase [Paenibacillus sp. NPDC058174]|uniref:CheR family methyltransferase n=1 Tax=Paenibacillus sp. NPDC058174 TaxID=3346366 RepID=UPI0036DE6973